MTILQFLVPRGQEEISAVLFSCEFVVKNDVVLLVFYVFSFLGWLTQGVSSSILNIKGYNIERYDRQFCDVDTGLPNLRGGGLCIYYSKYLTCDKNIWEQYNVSTQDLELQIVEFIRVKARNMVVLNIYRPPNGNVDTMINYLNTALSNIPRLDRKDVVIMGDFNINVSPDNLDAKKLTRFGQANSFEQLIKTPAHCTATWANTIDLFFSSITHVKDSRVLDLFLSDHMPIYIIKKMNTRKNKQYNTFTGRTYRNYTSEILHAKLEGFFGIDRILGIHDPVICWDSIYEMLISIADEIIPEKQFKAKVDRPAWLTDELMNLKNDRDYFFKKAKITWENEDWFLARNLRNRVNIAMRAAKSEYIKMQLNYNRDNPKKFWNLIQTEILPDEKD